MKKILNGGILLTLSLMAGIVNAGVSNTSAGFSNVIARDLFDLLPVPDNLEFMFGVKCRNGTVYASEGGNVSGGWSVATAVCHRGKDKNSALWVLRIPQMTSYPEGRGYVYTMVTRDGLAVPGTVGLDCAFTNNGWSCKKIVETEGLIFILTKDKNIQQNDSAFEYTKVIGSGRTSKLKPYVTD